ncbi:MAG: hypothetical protein RIS88_1447 [Pseudomonadota bacterium]|jgi:hypothetical protein
MAARDEKERDHPPPSRWEGEWGRDTAAPHSAGWGSAPGGGLGDTSANGSPQGSAYGSGRWGGGPGQDSASNYACPSATGYGQATPGYSGYRQGDAGPAGAGVSYAGAAGYSGYAGALAPQAQPPAPRTAGPATDDRARADWLDLDYQQWRDEQLRKLDDEYRSWRQARYRKFADEFDAWRSSRRQDTAPTQEQDAGTAPSATSPAPGIGGDPPSGGTAPPSASPPK